jgi:hypothetical protein
MRQAVCEYRDHIISQFKKYLLQLTTTIGLDQDSLGFQLFVLWEQTARIDSMKSRILFVRRKPKEKLAMRTSDVVFWRLP